VLLTKEQILQRRLKVERVDIGQGGEVMVKACPLHVMERSNSGIKSEAFGNEAYVFVHVVVDEAGKRLYADEDVAMVASTVDTEVLQLVVSTSYRLAKVSPEAEERIKKNWKTLGISQFGESPSASDTPIPTSSGTN
jgi:hypothetical protein